MSDLTRYKKLRVWMLEHDMTVSMLAGAVKTTPAYVSSMIKADTVTTGFYTRLVDAGLPVELLPTPHKVVKGRPKKVGA